MTVLAPARRPTALAILLIIGGVLGLIAAFALTLDKFDVALHPHALGHLGCDASLFLQCSKNLESPEGSAFGFPNPLIGLMGFSATITVGVATLAGARFPRWFWALFNLGMAGAIAFVMWLITKSIFVLGTLCPWCLVVWSAVTPMVVALTLYNLREGNLPLGRGGRRFGAAVYGWTPLITLIVYVVIVGLAQYRLDIIHHL